MENLKESLREDIQTIEKVLKPKLSKDDMSTVMLAIGCVALQANEADAKDLAPIIATTSKYGTSAVTQIIGALVAEVYDED